MGGQESGMMRSIRRTINSSSRNSRLLHTINTNNNMRLRRRPMAADTRGNTATTTATVTVIEKEMGMGTQTVRPCAEKGPGGT